MTQQQPFPLSSEFFSTLTRFEKEHSWWSDKTYMSMGNTTAQTAIRSTMTTYHEQMLWFACSGTKEQMNTFVTLLNKHCPRLSMLVLAGFLDFLNTQEQLQEEISKDLVRWYRDYKWSFPQFAFEKIESGSKAEDQVPTQDAS